jgi:GxxExxY protein
MSHGFSRIFTDQCHKHRINLLVMNIAPVVLKHSGVTEKAIRAFYDVFNELGHGFLESTYAGALAMALQESGLSVAREVPVPVWFRGHKVGQYYADFIVEGVVLLELKAARALDSSHEAQLLHYLRATDIEVGLLLNFGLRPQFRRLLFDNDRKRIRENPCESVAKASA